MASQVTLQVPHFQFRLRSGLSIGPDALERLWASACGCKDVRVSREARRTMNGESSYLYSLLAPRHAFDAGRAERRLAVLLGARFPNELVRLVRLEGGAAVVQ